MKLIIVLAILCMATIGYTAEMGFKPPDFDPNAPIDDEVIQECLTTEGEVPSWVYEHPDIAGKGYELTGIFLNKKQQGSDSLDTCQFCMYNKKLNKIINLVTLSRSERARRADKR